MHTPHTRAYCNPSHNLSLAGSVALPVRAQAPVATVTWPWPFSLLERRAKANLSDHGHRGLWLECRSTDLKVTGSTLDHKLTFFLVGRGVTI